MLAGRHEMCRVIFEEFDSFGSKLKFFARV
jgi:hypothetical protein